MSLIKDVHQQIKGLDVSSRNLRNFAFLVGGVLVIGAGYGLWKHAQPGVVLFLFMVGFSLILGGIVNPAILRPLYTAWMTLAFVLGWFVSHLILILFYYGIFSPIALFLRVFGKEFMDIDFRKKRTSYWVPRDPDRPGNYEKMY